MARKSATDFNKALAAKAASRSWAVVGGDTSMSSIAFTAFGYDAKLDKTTDVMWAERRWTTGEDDDYILRLADAARAHDLVLECLRELYVLDKERVFIFIEEPFPMGLVKSGRAKLNSGWIKQQCEVSGAVLGALSRWGYRNIWQINNAQWKGALRREGATLRKMPEGKWDVKAWAMQAYGLPDLPDLVKNKVGSKIQRPEQGYGAKAKPVQPDDVYDAAACMAFGHDFILSHNLV